MADVMLHLSLGVAAGTFGYAPAVVRRLLRRVPVAGVLGRLLATAYFLAVFAVVPNAIHWLGAPLEIARGWWMNVFLLHPLVDTVKSGGMLVGQLILATCFLVQYSLLLVAIMTRPGTRAPAVTVPTPTLQQ